MHAKRKKHSTGPEFRLEPRPISPYPPTKRADARIRKKQQQIKKEMKKEKHGACTWSLLLLPSLQRPTEPLRNPVNREGRPKSRPGMGCQHIGEKEQENVKRTTRRGTAAPKRGRKTQDPKKKKKPREPREEKK